MPMISNKSMLLIGGAALLAYPLISKAVAGNDLSIKFDKVTGYTFTAIPPRLNLGIQFKVKNPSQETFNITALSGNLYIAGSLVGNATLSQTLTIVPGATSYLALTFHLDTLGMVSDLIEILRGNSSRKLSLEFKGTVTVDGFNVPLNEGFSI